MSSQSPDESNRARAAGERPEGVQGFHLNGTSAIGSVPDQDGINRRIYHARDIASWYKTKALAASEVAALLKYQPSFYGRDVLDIGVGTGRTTRFIAPLSRRYVGVDYSPGMVAHLRSVMPEVDVREADMRDLSAFELGEFDFVLGPCNVIDAVSPEDRLVALHEVRRVLRTGGIFCFSSHNRSVPAAFRGPRLERSRNPVTLARNIGVYCRSLMNHAKVGRFRRVEVDYALLNDSGHDYAALHYYVSRGAQRKQLEQNGFRLLEVFDAAGRVLVDSEEDRQSASLLYVAERE